MTQKSKKPRISLVTKNRLPLMTCEPSLEQGCVPGAGPGFNHPNCEPDIIKCEPPGGPGKK